MQSLRTLESLIADHKLQSQVKHDRVTAEWLTAKCDAMCLKVRVLQNQMIKDTYTPEAVAALKRIKCVVRFSTNRAVFKWLSKNKNQSNYSDQSRQGQTARWTNHNSKQWSETCSNRGKNHAYMARLVLVLHLNGWKSGASLLSQSLSVAIAIT